MGEGLIEINVMGRSYQVPDGLTIMTAMEWIGYKFTRGCGCRGGFCGACGTFYRVPGDYKIYVGLACQERIVPGMYLTQIPFFPTQKAIYDLGKIDRPAQDLLELYPEIKKCVGCGACSKACPQDLKPIDYIGAALRGDWKKAAELSFDCIMCGLCASRCTGELVPYHIALFVRRYFSKSVRPKPQQIIERNKDVRAGKFDREVHALAGLSEEEMKKKYDQREFEKL
ncbi:4Fe-4S dicluster domain-containing protein [Candidatus Formimonas warabiya]|uniref:4Fe-4S ferredoxin n=1 Tax=Formimonas warabiya TaxID=1761012 RepID=A0A3G1KRW3_FORW1|nr:4Fe-4S dicluster domain-containing protein [Candidatus Formimonas warabiya]ATW25124.1 4Fe-4S ferredoxin [Candidatus Formimonas warabiya]